VKIEEYNRVAMKTQEYRTGNEADGKVSGETGLCLSLSVIRLTVSARPICIGLP